MKALVTGADGFIGSHLVEFLLDKGVDVVATVHREKNNIEHVSGKLEVVELDITDKSAVEKVVKNTDPDYVFHMAAQSFVIPSWKDAEKTYRTNIMGTNYLLDALRDSKAIVGLACSSAAYGLSYEKEIPIKETREFRPSSPYAISKAATDMLGFLYWRTYGLKTLRLRFFNTIGPRKTGSAIAEWTRGVAEVEAGARSELGVGNLEPIVDFTDVRDSIRGVWLLTQKGRWGDAYNVCSGMGNKMADILQKIIGMSNAKIGVFADQAKFRPSDDPIFIGDNTKLRALGWQPSVPLEKTLEDTLNYWRHKVRTEKR